MRRHVPRRVDEGEAAQREEKTTEKVESIEQAKRVRKC
jgi:hypothetical protein